MSLKIRQAISLATRRLTSLLAAYEAIKVGLEEDPINFDKNRLYAIFKVTSKVFDKGAKHV
jgi:hypothetical protein